MSVFNHLIIGVGKSLIGVIMMDSPRAKPQIAIVVMQNIDNPKKTTLVEIKGLNAGLIAEWMCLEKYSTITLNETYEAKSFSVKTGPETKPIKGYTLHGDCAEFHNMTYTEAQSFINQS